MGEMKDKEEMEVKEESLQALELRIQRQFKG